LFGSDLTSAVVKADVGIAAVAAATTPFGSYSFFFLLTF